MLVMKGFTAVLLLMLLSSQVVLQTVPTRPPRVLEPNRPDQGTRAWYDELRKRENMPTGIGAVNNQNVVNAAIAQIYEQARKKLAPTVEEKRLYAEFLSQPNTGIFRLGGRIDCKYILDVTKPDQGCYNQYIPGGALAFSFRRADYSHLVYSDFKRMNDDFVLPGTFVLGLVAPLGDVPIETVHPDSRLVEDLIAFSPATGINDVADQDRQIAGGFKIGDLIYRKSAPVRDQTTYLLRSVAYRAKFLNLPKSESKRGRGSLDEDDRSDVTVVFRLVSKGADDTYLVLWRELARKASPLLTVDFAEQ